MKKYYLLLIVFLAVNTLVVCAEPDKSLGIERSIVTKIEWNDEYKLILIHSITVKKMIDQPTVVDDSFIIPVKVEAFENSTLTTGEARQFVIDHSSLGNDHIFGQEVKVFKDFSGQTKVSPNEINNSIKELKNQIEVDWNNPQNVDVKKQSPWLTIWQLIKAFKESIFIIIGIVLLAYFYFPKRNE